MTSVNYRNTTATKVARLTIPSTVVSDCREALHFGVATRRMTTERTLNDEPFTISYALRALLLNGLAFLASAVGVWYSYTLLRVTRNKGQR